MARVAAILALIFAGCAPMLFGHAHAPARPSHLLVDLHNQDVAADETVTITWWVATGVVGSSTILVPKGEDRVFDLGPSHPDGLQIVATAWAGIPGGAGGLVFQTPDYDAGWIFDVNYPSGFAAIRR